MLPPKVSVVMSVYNGADTVDEAITSIRDQTFADFEFVIIDDGSSDGTAEILARHAAADPRIVRLHHANQGLVRSLNRGIAAARGALIARQDADDLSLPERLASQVAVMDAEPDVVLIGTAWYEQTPAGLLPSRPVDSARLQRSLYLHNPFPHTSVLYRREAVLAAGGYDESFDTSQDFELWMRLAARGRVVALPTPLVVRRLQATSISNRKRARQVWNGLRARLRYRRAGTVAALSASAYQAATSSAPDWLVARLRAARLARTTDQD